MNVSTSAWPGAQLLLLGAVDTPFAVLGSVSDAIASAGSIPASKPMQ
jgi:hypothetical protein